MERRLPIGIQSFDIIRKDNYLYVDKTAIVYYLAHNTRYSFLSRPRQFGKTLLISTLEAYFQGRRELFEGLKIMDLEAEWKSYPVLRFQMPNGGYEALASNIDITLLKYENLYNIERVTDNHAARFGYLLQMIKAKTGTPSVILIDEYDAPLRNTLYNAEEHERCRDFYRSFFNNLKSKESSIRFIFITGISKFTQLSLFSALNNLEVITFDPEYEALCGITEEELHTAMQPEVKAMAVGNNWTIEKTYAKLKQWYDGYHFSEDMTDIYNPYSLVNALKKKRLQDYWVQSGSTKSLSDYFHNNVTEMPELDNVAINSRRLFSSDMTLSDPHIFLFQTGCLTLKGIDVDDYILGIPNEEVRYSMYENILPIIVSKDSNVVDSCIRRIKEYLKRLDVDNAMAQLQQLVAETPYSLLNEYKTLEEHFRFITAQTFYLCGYDVRTEVTVSHGRIDLVVNTRRQILLFEIETTQNGGIAAARKQIIDQGYMAAFTAEPLPVVAVAIEFDTDKKQMVDYEVVNA